MSLVQMMMPLYQNCMLCVSKMLLHTDTHHHFYVIASSTQFIVNTNNVRSAVQEGYFKDNFVNFFVKRLVRRPPLINRGMHECDNKCKRVPFTLVELNEEIVSNGGLGWGGSIWKGGRAKLIRTRIRISCIGLGGIN